jgi:hypothetical protein
LLFREVASVRDAGGTLLEITGQSPSDSGDTLKMVWLLIMIAICVLGCLCLLSLISNIVEATQPVQRPVSRPRLRQLNPWQVRNTFPIGVFDGTHVHHSTARRQHDHKECTGKAAGLDGETGDDCCPHSRTLPDDTCAICLDEYVVGDKLRCLPCEHAFHSKCILKWLTERSATCPLCKVDYYESDNDEEEDDDVPVSAPLSSSWSSVPPETSSVPTEPPQASQDLGRAPGTWIRSFFRRRRQPNQIMDGVVQASLSEPLLTSIEEAPTIEGTGVLTAEVSQGADSHRGDTGVGNESPEEPTAAPGTELEAV